MKYFEQIFYELEKGGWRIDIKIDGVTMRRFEFDSESKGRSFFKLVSDIVHYFKS